MNTSGIELSWYWTGPNDRGRATKHCAKVGDYGNVLIEREGDDRACITVPFWVIRALAQTPEVKDEGNT